MIKPIKPDLNLFVTEVALLVGALGALEDSKGPTVHAQIIRRLIQMFKMLLRPQFTVHEDNPRLEGPYGFIEVKV